MKSGKFVLRIAPAMHHRLSRQARERGVSLNQICKELIESALEKGPDSFQPPSFLAPILKSLRDSFKEKLLGVLLFGSQVSGRASALSDWDLLIVLDLSIPLHRSLYSWWDESIRPEGDRVVNPHFSHLPPSPAEAGTLWLEVAVNSRILWEKGMLMTSGLEGIKHFIASGAARRYWSHGQPYWVKQDEEPGTRP